MFLYSFKIKILILNYPISSDILKFRTAALSPPKLNVEFAMYKLCARQVHGCGNRSVIDCDILHT